MSGLTGADLAAARTMRSAAADRREGDAVREAWEERAAIIEEGAKVPRATAEAWAEVAVQRVRGAVEPLTPERVRLLVASGALRRAP